MKQNQEQQNNFWIDHQNIAENTAWTETENALFVPLIDNMG